MVQFSFNLFISVKVNSRTLSVYARTQEAEMTVQLNRHLSDHDVAQNLAFAHLNS